MKLYRNLRYRPSLHGSGYLHLKLHNRLVSRESDSLIEWRMPLVQYRSLDILGSVPFVGCQYLGVLRYLGAVLCSALSCDILTDAFVSWIVKTLGREANFDILIECVFSVGTLNFGLILG